MPDLSHARQLALIQECLDSVHWDAPLSGMPKLKPEDDDDDDPSPRELALSKKAQTLMHDLRQRRPNIRKHAEHDQKSHGNWADGIKSLSDRDLAISGLDQARQIMSKIPTENVSYEYLLQAGLVTGKTPWPQKKVGGDWGDGIINLELSSEGQVVIDTVMATGRQAREIIDRLVDEQTSEDRALIAELEQEAQFARSEAEAARDAQNVAQRESTVEMYHGLVDLLPPTIQQELREHIDRIDTEAYSSGPTWGWRAEAKKILLKEMDAITQDPAIELFLKETAMTNPGYKDWTVGSMLNEFWTVVSMNVPKDKLLQSAYDTANAKLIAANNQMLKLKSNITKARIAITESVLAANRVDFGTGDMSSKISKITPKKNALSRDQIVSAIAEYGRRVPREWIDDYRPGHEISVVKRGKYYPVNKWVRVSVHAWPKVLTHEFTHGHQYRNKAILALERLFLSSRAAQIGPSALKPMKYESDREKWYELGLGEEYATKVYSDGITEVSTMASEFVWYGTPPKVSTDLADFWLGTLLLA